MIKKVVNKKDEKIKLIFKIDRGPDKILEDRGCFLYLCKNRLELICNYDWRNNFCMKDDTVQFHLIIQKHNLSICRTLYTLDGPEPEKLHHCLQLYYPGGETWVYLSHEDCNEMFDMIRHWLNNDRHEDLIH
jgi:hypothetical protein